MLQTIIKSHKGTDTVEKMTLVELTNFLDSVVEDVKYNSDMGYSSSFFAKEKELVSKINDYDKGTRIRLYHSHVKKIGDYDLDSENKIF